jgi:hypothetical protein
MYAIFIGCSAIVSAIFSIHILIHVLMLLAAILGQCEKVIWCIIFWGLRSLKHMWEDEFDYIAGRDIEK